MHSEQFEVEEQEAVNGLASLGHGGHHHHHGGHGGGGWGNQTWVVPYGVPGWGPVLPYTECNPNVEPDCPYIGPGMSGMGGITQRFSTLSTASGSYVQTSPWALNQMPTYNLQRRRDFLRANLNNPAFAQNKYQMNYELGIVLLVLRTRGIF